MIIKNVMVKFIHKKTKTVKFEDTKTIEHKTTKDSKNNIKIDIIVSPPKIDTYKIKPPKCGTCHGRGTVFSPLGRKPCPNPKCNGGYIRI